jgi:r-opsin
LGWNRFIFEGLGTTCTFDYTSQTFWDRLYMLILVTGGFLVPLVIILVSYIFILIKLSKRGHHIVSQNSDHRSHELQLRQLSAYYSHPTKLLNDEQSRNEIILELNDNNQIPQLLRRTEVRVTRTALLVFAIYCIAWGPYALMTILSQFGFNSLINAYTTAMLGLFTKTAACVNPLIYALSSAAFRRQICTRVKSFYISRRSNSSNYDSNRRIINIKINPPGTTSDLSDP